MILRRDAAIFGPEFMNPLMRVSENQVEGAERSDANEGATWETFGVLRNWVDGKLGYGASQ